MGRTRHPPASGVGGNQENGTNLSGWPSALVPRLGPNAQAYDPLRPAAEQVRASWRTPPRMHNETMMLRQAASPLSLHAPYPNPFASTTTIAYTVSEPMYVSLSLYDALGKLVWQTGHDAGAGTHTVPVVLGGNVPGVYRLVMHGGAFTAVHSLILIK